MENGTNFIFIFSRLEGAYGRPRGFWARPPEPFPAPSAQAMVFCDPYLELCSLLRDWLSLLGDLPDRKLEVKIVIVFLWSLRLNITGQC